MPNALGNLVTVQGPKAVAGETWLALSNGARTSYQSLGITQSVATVDGGNYTFNLNYTGALGAALANTKIGVYVDDVLIGSYSNTSINTALAWKAPSFVFRGDGLAHTLKVQLEGANTTTATAAMIEGLKLVETLPDSARTVFGFIGTAIALPGIAAQLAATDQNAVLKNELLGLPLGSAVSDGVRSVTTTISAGAIDLTGWTLDKLSVRLPNTVAGTVQLQVRSTSTEKGNTSSASTTRNVAVQVLAGAACATPAGVSPYVSYVNNTAVTQVNAGVANPNTMLVVRSLDPARSGQYAISIPALGIAEASGATDANYDSWLAGLGVAISGAFMSEIERSKGA